uniref:Uncharacterized protein n=1 Tax=Romanomermis culicivorax TaxID=13658 RepID=A0A915IMG8_ROMCU
MWKNKKNCVLQHRTMLHHRAILYQRQCYKMSVENLLLGPYAIRETIKENTYSLIGQVLVSGLSTNSRNIKLTSLEKKLAKKM